MTRRKHLGVVAASVLAPLRAGASSDRAPADPVVLTLTRAQACRIQTILVVKVMEWERRDKKVAGSIQEVLDIVNRGVNGR